MEERKTINKEKLIKMDEEVQKFYDMKKIQCFLFFYEKHLERAQFQKCNFIENNYCNHKRTSECLEKNEDKVAV